MPELPSGRGFDGGWTGPTSIAGIEQSATHSKPPARGRLGAHLLAVLAVIVTVTGCGGPEMATEDLGDNSESFSDRVSQAILEATAGGASESQLEILAQARDLGQVTFDQAREATFNTMDCFENAGLSSEYIEYQEPSGFLLPSYGVQAEVEGLSDDQTLGFIDGCDRQEGFWVNYLYQTQPSTQEVREAHFVSLLPQIRECLVANGTLVEDDATSDEVKLAISGLMFESAGAGAPVNCASEVGVGPY